MRSTIVSSCNITNEQCWGRIGDTFCRTHSSSCMARLIGIQSKLWLFVCFGNGITIPIFSGIKSLWLWFYFQDERIAPWHSFSYCSRDYNSAVFIPFHIKDQQHRRSQRHPAASRMLTTEARQRKFLPWRSGKFSPMYHFCILCTYIAATIKVPSYEYISKNAMIMSFTATDDTYKWENKSVKLQKVAIFKINYKWKRMWK